MGTNGPMANCQRISWSDELANGCAMSHLGTKVALLRTAAGTRCPDLEQVFDVAQGGASVVERLGGTA